MTRPDSPPRVRLTEAADWLGRSVRVEPPAADAELNGMTLDSRLVRPGDLYVAAPGAQTHGARYAAAAVAAGAVAVLTDPTGSQLTGALGVPVLTVDSPREVVGLLAARLHGHPARSMRTFAVTGTQGKTTTTRLAAGALEHAGIAAAAIGTVGTRIAGEDVPSALTTPEAAELQALFAVMRERQVQACAMEVSSHALVMGRVDGVVFDVAAFTNLGRDHLDFHRDLEDYFAAKAMLFTPDRARLGLVNVDDAHGRRLLDQASVPMRTFSAQGSDADWTASAVRPSGTGSVFVLRDPGGTEREVTVPLPGDFNVANALCALAGLAECGFDLDDVAPALAAVSGVPGRLEPVDAGQDFLAVVDYAHKPDALDAVLRSLRRRTPGRLIAVIGAGGDRDRGKRPLMGAVAAGLADVLVVTDDNPRSEDPAAIRAEVLAGARSESVEVHEVGDRREAIALAVATARTGDCLVVAGKGHETGQEIAGTVHPFDDRVELAEALRGLASRGRMMTR